MNYDAKTEINIRVNPLRSVISMLMPEIQSNIRKDIINFIESLSYDGFILAGNSVANMIENIDIKGDLDFWVTDKEKYLDVLTEFKSKNPLRYDIYLSMIEMTFENFPVVSLILADRSAEETVNSFDFDYCRCYYTKQTGCMASEVCLNSIFTKTICREIAYGDIRPNRIIKALKYGYSFNKNFWHYHQGLIKNKLKLICHICRVSRKKYYHRDFFCTSHMLNKNILIQNDDLELKYFEQTTLDIKITDPSRVDDSINEFRQIFDKYYMEIKSRLRLPILLSFGPADYDLVKTYVNRIIIFNPVRDGNYLEARFDDKLIRKIKFHNDFDIDIDDEEKPIPKSKSSQKVNKFEEEEEPIPKSKSSRKVNKFKEVEEIEEYEVVEKEVEEKDPMPKSKSSRKVNKCDDDDEIEEPKRKPSRKVNKFDDEDEEPIPKKKSSIKVNKNPKNKSNKKNKSKIKNSSNSSNECENNNQYHGRLNLNYDPSDPTNPIDNVLYLNNNKTSYLRIRQLPKDLKIHAMKNFNEMFALHPEKKHKIIMFLEEVEVNRWQQSYLNTPSYEMNTLRTQSYMYSGFDVSNNNNQLPKKFQIYYDYMKSIDKKYNQVVANWYQDKNDYIAYHADCEDGMIPNAEISIISLYENDVNDSENYRTFSFMPKNDKIDCWYDKVNIMARHGTIITMCGNTQKEFKHGIEKTNDNVIPRISLSFRQMIKT